jgi:hypothetical protein
LNKQFMPFEEAVRIMGSLDLQWSDKPTIEEVQADVDVEIDPISMLPESPEDEAARLQQDFMARQKAIEFAQSEAEKAAPYNQEAPEEAPSEERTHAFRES